MGVCNVPVDSVFATLQTYLSGMYVNDFVKFGKVYKVFLQAESEFTNAPGDIGQFYVRNNDGKMVPLSTLVTITRMSGPNLVTRFNLYNSAEIIGATAPGYSSGQAIRIMEGVASKSSLAGCFSFNSSNQCAAHWTVLRSTPSCTISHSGDSSRSLPIFWCSSLIA